MGKWKYIYTQVFLTPALVNGEWSASRTGLFTPMERVQGWVDSRYCLNNTEERPFLTLPRFEFRPLCRPVPKPVAIPSELPLLFLAIPSELPPLFLAIPSELPPLFLYENCYLLYVTWWNLVWHKFTDVSEVCCSSTVLVLAPSLMFVWLGFRPRRQT
jgi:hypothetical protein